MMTCLLMFPSRWNKKTGSNAYVNIALLLKGNTELADMFSGGLLQVSDDGKIEAKPRTSKEKIIKYNLAKETILL